MDCPIPFNTFPSMFSMTVSRIGCDFLLLQATMKLPEEVTVILG